MPLLWAHHPSALNLIMEDSDEKGLDWMSSFQFEVLKLYVFLSSSPLAPLEGQELTKSLKSPGEDEQLYATQVRSCKGGGRSWLS